MVYIVGIGPGSREYILPKAIETLEQCYIVLGFNRALESLDFIKTNKKQVNSLREVLEYINESSRKPGEDIAIVASGDPLYYGITNYIKNNYKGEIKVIPGLSSFQYLMSKLQIPWNQAFTGSMHGREEEFIDKVKAHEVSIWLTDKKNSPSELCKKLLEQNMDLKVYVGENLSYEDEKITCGIASEFVHREFSELCVVVIEKCTL